MTLYDTYVAEIAARAKQGLQPKPIDDGALTAELITHITDAGSAHSKDCLHYLIYNTLPGTTSAAGVKAGGNHTRLDLNNLSLDNQIDPAFNPDNVGKFMPNYGFGLYYYTPKWYVGFSSPHLINYDFNATQRHYFLIAGAIFNIPICKVNHIKDAIYHLQSLNISIISASEKSVKNILSHFSNIFGYLSGLTL